jgi:hypothetical protein
MITRKYLKSIGEFIGRSDIRTIRKWCKKNNLFIHKDSTGEFVINSEFELVYNMPLIIRLKEKYKDAWQEYFEAYEKDELMKMLDDDFGFKDKKTKSSYTTKGKIASLLFKKSA